MTKIEQLKVDSAEPHLRFQLSFISNLAFNTKEQGTQGTHCLYQFGSVKHKIHIFACNRANLRIRMFNRLVFSLSELEKGSTL